jgi:hypothetical protein
MPLVLTDIDQGRRAAPFKKKEGELQRMDESME